MWLFFFFLLLLRVAEGMKRSAMAARVRPGEEPGLLGAVRRKLFDLLQNSAFYSVSAVLEQARDTTLYEEMIVLHAKLNAHSEVLKVKAGRTSCDVCGVKIYAQKRCVNVI
jgi:hypothetical protein